MAATTHGMPRLEVTATDDMDLHSDSGLDFDDGDIELHLDPALPAQPEDDDIIIQDDDISIKDAPTNAGQDVHTVDADQDDFMIDHEDFFEEDAVQYNDPAPADPGTGAPSIPANTATPAPVEDDLIDYSDDEDEPVWGEPLPTDFGATPPVQKDESEASAQHVDHLNPVASNNDYAYEPQDQDQGEGVGIYETLYQPELDQEAETKNEADDHTEGDDGGVQLEAFDAQADDNERLSSDHQERPLCESRPITINYEGNELWMFKEHDAEESGDWLLEDISIVHSSLSELLQACRVSLGENISHETELGLRFDHLHNMELYEDNTACVAVSLERLLDLYYTLHSQDGNDDPESFYICLLSRPRFATLLSDVAKHADQGSGYAGFNAAVAAGETHFVDAYSGHSTEHEATEWENEEEQHAGSDSASGADDNAGHEEHEEHDEDGPPHENKEEANKEEASDEHDEDFDPEDTAYLEQVLSHDEGAVAYGNADVNEESGKHDDTQSQIAQQGPASVDKQPTEQMDNDTVDYSDDEEQEDVAKPSTRDSNDPSPSSSTVQGDDIPTDEHVAETASSKHPVGESSANPEHGNYPHAEEQLGHAENTELYQDFNEHYEEDPFSEFQAGEAKGYPAEADFEGFTNQDYTGYDYQDVDQELQNDFLSGGDFDGANAGDSTNAAKGFTGEDDYLNLTDAPEWAAAQDQLPPPPEDEDLVFDDYTEHGQEEEDGLVEQPAVAASSAADPVAASSTDLHETSPQGQKRSIDEVGDLVGDALDTTGAPKLSHSHGSIVDADLFFLDTKRPRV
jgi:hypothetical protein